MDLYIIRHAWAGQHGDPRWPDDSQRPLTEDGRVRFSHVIAKLSRRGFAPEIIGASPMVRCLQTAELVAAGVGGPAKIVQLDELLPGGALDGLVAWTVRQSRKHHQVAWVGHAPDVGQLTTAMLGAAAGWLRFAKGAIATLRFDGLPQVGTGELRWMVTAKVLGC
jgi:phosphohistidine phosphatase